LGDFKKIGANVLDLALSLTIRYAKRGIRRKVGES